MKIYDRAYYDRTLPETWFGRFGLLRPDQLAAVCYAFGMPFWGDETYANREPYIVLSIGCGRGELEAQIERMGPRVIGTDPSDAVERIYAGQNFERKSASEAVRDVFRADTVIFCESLEHIERAEIDLAFDMLRMRRARVIVVNWPSFMPLETNGWDHVTRIDDALYDELSEGFDVVVRRGSHLVLDGRDT